MSGQASKNKHLEVRSLAVLYGMASLRSTVLARQAQRYLQQTGGEMLSAQEELEACLAEELDALQDWRVGGPPGYRME